MGQEEKNEKWVKHYSSNHQILLVGEGDFSFSFSLALSFGSACNIVASSLDSYDVVVKKYKKAKSNLKGLKTLGATVLHGVDATKMKLHPGLRMRFFDRVIFNFPHAGFHGKEDNVLMIGMHKELVSGFFRSASGMLQAEGEIHVSHKTSSPYCDWNIVELAWQSALTLFERLKFKKEDYPGYNQKRGYGTRCDDPFPLGECSTFKFGFSVTKFDAFKQCLDWPTLFDRGYPQTSIGSNTSGFHIPRCVQPSAISIERDFFDRGSVHAFHNYGRGADAVKFSFFESIRHEHERHMIEARGLSQQVQGLPFKINNQQIQIEPEKFPRKFTTNLDFSGYTNRTINHSTVMQNQNDASKQYLHRSTLFDQGYPQTSIGSNTSGFHIPGRVHPSAISIWRDFFDGGSVNAFHNYGRGADAVKFTFFEHERHMTEARGLSQQVQGLPLKINNQQVPWRN